MRVFLECVYLGLFGILVGISVEVIWQIVLIVLMYAIWGAYSSFRGYQAGRLNGTPANYKPV